MIDSASEMAGAGPELRKARRQKSPRQTSADFDRLPPHAPEAEQGVVGCVLLKPSECLDELLEAGFVPEWCYDLRHQVILGQALKLHSAGKAWDVIVLQQALQDAGDLVRIGGLAYLGEVQDKVPSAANLDYYLEIVREKWQARMLLATFTDAAAQVWEHTGDVTGLIGRVHQEILRIEQAVTRDSEVRIKAILNDRVIPRLEAHYTRGRAQISGLVTTGLEYLDKIFCGLGGNENGNYHVFAARPNVGKTSLVTGMALHAALDFEWNREVTEAEAHELEAAGGSVIRTEDGRWLAKTRGVPVGISSLEMSADSLGFKMLFQRAQADIQRWRTGFATAADFPPLTLAAAALAKANNILIDDTPRETIQSIKAKWRRWHRQHGVRFFMLDYLQLIKSATKRFRPDRVQEMEEISAELQALGKELNCPMAVIAQLNRDYEKEPTRLPRLSDLKNCGAIEQDADSVTILYKPSLKKMGTSEDTPDGKFFKDCMQTKFGENWRKWDGRPERINALVEKNKYGPKGDAKLLFLKSSTLFVDYNRWLIDNGFKKPALGEGKGSGSAQQEELRGETEEA